MTYREEYGDLFSVPADYYLAHCISADFGMGRGIAVEFNKCFDMKNKLKNKYPDYLLLWQSKEKTGDCIHQGKVFNLVTKERYWMKPTYQSLRAALLEMKRLCNDNNIEKIAMPTMGAGLDRLDWNKVSGIIKDIFVNTDIEILICKK